MTDSPTVDCSEGVIPQLATSIIVALSPSLQVAIGSTGRDCARPVLRHGAGLNRNATQFLRDQTFSNRLFSHACQLPEWPRML